jgi:hypothetical protein
VIEVGGLGFVLEYGLIEKKTLVSDGNSGEDEAKRCEVGKI